MNNQPKLTIDEFGIKRWWLNGKYHREDGPAFENKDGDKIWYINGFLHREDGPAIEYSSGHKEWFINGKQHRVDGPAIEFPNGHKEWWINGHKITKEDFYAEVKENLRNNLVGYHLKTIVKGQIGESSKILEEVLELQDAEEQNCKIMALNELSDIIGAIDLYLKNKYPDVDISDLIVMSKITQRAFESGARK